MQSAADQAMATRERERAPVPEKTPEGSDEGPLEFEGEEEEAGIDYDSDASTKVLGS